MKQKIEEYVYSLIPNSLSQARKKELSAELCAHILDKADYYRSIGYPQEESIDLALRDMGEDDDMKRNIQSEFEQLYKERTWWAVVVGIFIAAMNIFANLLSIGMEDASDSSLLQLFYYIITLGQGGKIQGLLSIDGNVGVAVSFMMSLALLAVIAFARCKRYRKTLMSVGVVSLIIGVFDCAIPLSAFYSLTVNAEYLIQTFTPLSIYVKTTVIEDVFGYAAFLFMPLCALFCFVAAFKIKNRTEKRKKSPKKSVAAFFFVCLAVAVSSSCLYPYASSRIGEMYYYSPDSFDSFSYVEAKSLKVFESVSKANSYKAAAAVLRENGYLPLDEYKENLGRAEKKTLIYTVKNNLGNRNLELWLPQRDEESQLLGNIIFMKRDKDEKVSFCSVGSLLPFPGYESRDQDYYITSGYVDSQKYVSNFKALKLGQNEKSVLKMLEKNADVVSKCRERKGEIVIDTVRILAQEYFSPYKPKKLPEELEEMRFSDSDLILAAEEIQIYTELTFVDEKLTGGTLHCDYTGFDLDENSDASNADGFYKIITQTYEVR